jgi:two-component system LytT family response regulator
MADRIRVIIVDDEPLARKGLRMLCERDPELELACECPDGRSAVAAVEQVEPDLLLLDIRLPDMDGFEVLEAIGGERMPHVIFVTAYDCFALRAFEVHALDYLLKPFDDERFFDAIRRAKEAIRRPDPGDLRDRLLDLASVAGLGMESLGGARHRTCPPATSDEGRLSRIAIREKGRVHLVPVDDIVWIEADNYRVWIHARGKAHVFRESLRALEARLDPRRFFRVSRSAIVSLDRITEIQPFARGSHVVILDSGTRVLLSRSRREALASLLGQSL